MPKWIRDLLTPENVRVFVDLVKKAFSKSARVLAVGSTGTGKTTLLDAIEQQLIPRMIEEINRTRFAQERKIKIKKNTIKITDTPGHRIDPDDEASPYLNPQFTGAINKGPYVGVLNVVSYGYHQYDISPRPDFSEEKISTFLSEHRKCELIGLQSWVPNLAKIGHDPFVITIVTKADLWNGTRGVIKHYERGAYYKELCRLAGRDVEHYVVIMSSRRQKLYGQINPKSSWNDDDRAKARTNLIDQLFHAIAAKR